MISFRAIAEDSFSAVLAMKRPESSLLLKADADEGNA